VQRFLSFSIQTYIFLPCIHTNTHTHTHTHTQTHTHTHTDAHTHTHTHMNSLDHHPQNTHTKMNDSNVYFLSIPDGMSNHLFPICLWYVLFIILKVFSKGYAFLYIN